ncbi:MAG: pyridoxamine 5'-phosphate oxidase family protein [Anaerolineales bacterium]
MNREKLDEAMALSEKLGHVFLATADEDGVPHIAAAGRLSGASGDRVVLEEWFCPGTMENLEETRDIALAVWSAEEDQGYQLIGRVEQIIEMNVLDGYAPGQEERMPVAQIERRLLIQVEQVLDFSQAPHCDVPDVTAPQ